MPEGPLSRAARQEWGGSTIAARSWGAGWCNFSTPPPHLARDHAPRRGGEPVHLEHEAREEVLCVVLGPERAELQVHAARVAQYRDIRHRRRRGCRGFRRERRHGSGCRRSRRLPGQRRRRFGNHQRGPSGGGASRPYQSPLRRRAAAATTRRMPGEPTPRPILTVSRMPCRGASLCTAARVARIR